MVFDLTDDLKLAYISIQYVRKLTVLSLILTYRTEVLWYPEDPLVGDTAVLAPIPVMAAS